MGRWKYGLVAAATAAALTTLGAPVGAGDVPVAGPINLHVNVAAADAQAVYDGLTIELVDDSGPTDILPTGLCADPVENSYQQGRHHVALTTCATAPFGNYTLNVSGVPATKNLAVNCFPAGASSNLLVHSSTSNCSVWVYGPMLAVDKIVDGGSAVPSDFDLELYAGDAGTPYATFNDPNASLCDTVIDPANCAVIDITPGDWQLGEMSEYGYVPAGAACTSDWDFYEERLPNGLGQFTVSDVWHYFYCTVTNVYAEGRLVVDVGVTNDHGGTAGPTDVSVEVYRHPGGTQVIAPTACAADGSCLDLMLPIGDYVVGYSGPAGYTREVTQVVIAPPPPQPVEAIADDPDAVFTIDGGGTVEITIAIDDPAPPATTTTTTIAVTTTSLGAGAGTLPPTGSGSSSRNLVAALALVLVVSGGTMLVTRRRA